MLPVTHGDSLHRLTVLFYTVILVAATALPFASHMSGLVLPGQCRGAGRAVSDLRHPICVAYSDELAEENLPLSILYLSLLFAALLVDHYLRV